MLLGLYFLCRYCVCMVVKLYIHFANIIGSFPSLNIKTNNYFRNININCLDICEVTHLCAKYDSLRGAQLHVHVKTPLAFWGD
jgi:hypothetical protein